MALVQFNWVSCRAKIGRASYAVSIALEVAAISQQEPKSPSLEQFLRLKALQYRAAQTRSGNRDRVDRSPGREFHAAPIARSVARDLDPNLRLREGSNRPHLAPVRRAKPDLGDACAAASALRWRRCARAMCRNASLPGKCRGESKTSVKRLAWSLGRPHDCA